MSKLVSDRIKRCLDLAGINQSALADSLEVTRSAISLWISGVNEPDAATLVKIANICDVPLDELLGRAELNENRRWPKDVFKEPPDEFDKELDDDEEWERARLRRLREKDQTAQDAQKGTQEPPKGSAGAEGLGNSYTDWKAVAMSLSEALRLREQTELARVREVEAPKAQACAVVATCDRMARGAVCARLARRSYGLGQHSADQSASVCTEILQQIKKTLPEGRATRNFYCCRVSSLTV